MINKVLTNENKSIINALKNNDSNVFLKIYANEFNKVRTMVKNFHNLNLEPEDVFQEGLTRAVINIRKGVFNGDSTFSTYLYGICRNVCLKEYNRSKLLTTNEIGDVKEEVENDYFDTMQLMLELKEKLDEGCKKIIDLRFGIGHTDDSIIRFESIAAILNISADNARQRFGRCLAKLKKLVSGNPMFNQLID